MFRTGLAKDGYDGDIGVGVGAGGRCVPMGNAASGAPGEPVHRVLRSARGGRIVRLSARIHQALGSARMRSVDSGCKPYSHILTQGVNPIPVVRF